MDLKPVYLISGSDWPKVDAAMARLRARFPEESIEQLSVGDEGADIVAACNALDLLGGPRLVLVRGADQIEDEESRAIAEYLKSPTPETCLALFGAGGIDPRSAFVKAVEAVGEVRFFDAPDRKQAADWVVKRFATENVTCPLPVARRLVELVGEDMGDLAPEVEKLIVFARGESPEIEDVEALVPPQVEIKPWEITDAWGRRDSASMIALAVADIEAPGDVNRVVAQLSAHVRKVWRAAGLLERGGTQADVAKALGMKPYPTQKLVAQAQRFGAAELGACDRPAGPARHGDQGRQPPERSLRARARAGRDRDGMSGQTAAAAVATLVSIACTVVVARRAVDRAAIRAPLIAWTIAFGLFAIADAALWYGAARGWTAPVFRLYYLTGGILVVAYLAVGELLLVLPGRRVARVTAATMLFLTFAAISGVLAAQVDSAKLAAAGAAPPNGALVGTPPIALAIVLNSVGTVDRARRFGAVRTAPARLATAAGRTRGGGRGAHRERHATRQLHAVRARPGPRRGADLSGAGYAAVVWPAMRR